jgi:copper chaperone CopZ
MTSKTLKINNIGCDGCVKTIQNELSELPGVKFVTGSVPEKTVTVEFETPAALDAIFEKLDEIEYPADPVKA